jgi:hypothetical protein
MLERKVQYQNAATGKIGEAKYWFVYLGSRDCTLNRKYFCEEIQPVTGGMNFSLLSSGYIEGNGYSAKGKLESLPGMKIRNEQGERLITLDSIECIYEYGEKVLMTGGERGDFVIDIEGTPMTARKFELTEYKLVEVDGEKTLKPAGDAVKLSAIAFVKGGLQRAAASVAPPAAPATK